MVLKLWHVSESPVGLIKRRLLSPTLRVSGQPIWGSLGFSGVLVSDGSQVTWMLVTLGPHLETRWPGGLGLPSGRTQPEGVHDSQAVPYDPYVSGFIDLTQARVFLVKNPQEVLSALPLTSLPQPWFSENGCFCLQGWKLWAVLCGNIDYSNFICIIRIFKGLQLLGNLPVGG